MKKIQPNSNIASKFLNGIVTKVNTIIDKLIVDVKVNGESVVTVNEDGEREADIDLSLGDQNVKQSHTTDNKDYRVLLSKSDNDTEETDIARKNTNLKYNPSTGNLQATKLNGNTIPSGSGNDTLAKTSDIPDMTNYIQKSQTSGLVKNDGTIDQSDYVESSDLATVATSGSYNDLIDTPTIPSGQIQSDWEQDDDTEVDYIKNKPTLADVATSGSYNDLSDTPTIPIVNDATLTIKQNGTSVGTFTANDSDDVTVNLTDTTYTASGLVSIDANNNITTTAEVNQNAFAKVKVGSTTVTADAKQDTLEFVAGDNVALTADATNDKVTITATDTTYTGTGLISVDSSTHVISTSAEENQNAFGKVKVGSTTVTADAKIDTLELVQGTNITLTPDATNDKVTIATTAEVNQNAFSNVKVGDTTIEAESKTDTLELIQGSNVTLTPNATNDSITIAATDTNTHRPIKMNGSQILGDNTTALNLKAGDNMTLSNSSGTVTFTATDTTYTASGLVSIDANNNITTTATANTGTVTKVSTGAGLTGGDITGTGTIKCKLKSETVSTLATASRGSTANREYPVGLDKNSVLSVNVPWENTTYTGTGLISINSNNVISTTATNNTGTVTKVSTGAGLTGGDVTTTGTIKCDLKSETKSTLASASKGTTASREYAVGLDKNGDLSVNIPWTDTKVTAVGNHYAPSADSGSVLDVDASGGSAATWNSTNMVTGVTISRDAKGHVTNLSVDSIKMPTNPNTDTKVTQTNDTTSEALPLLIANSTTTPDTATARKNVNLTFSPTDQILTVKNNADYSKYPLVIDMSGRTAVTVANAGTDVKVLQTKANYAYDYTSDGTHYTGTKVFEAYPISMIANNSDKDGYNSGVRLGSHNGTTIVGAGESSLTFAKVFSAYNNENLYLTCDGSIYIYTGLANTSTSYKGWGKINNSDSTASDYSSGNSNTYVTFSAYGSEILDKNKQPTGIYRQGDLYLELGNSTASGAQGNSRGNIRLFSNNANYLRIMTADNLSYNNKIIRFPDPGNSNKNIQYQDTISSSDITTGTATASKTVRADYLNTAIKSLITTAMTWHLVEASTSTPSYVTIPTTTPWMDVKVNVILTDYALTIPLFFTHFDVSDTTYGSCEMRGGWQQDSSNGAVISVKSEISGNTYKFTVTRCIVNRVNANYKLILYYR